MSHDTNPFGHFGAFENDDLLLGMLAQGAEDEPTHKLYAVWRESGDFLTGSYDLVDLATGQNIRSGKTTCSKNDGDEIIALLERERDRCADFVWRIGASETIRGCEIGVVIGDTQLIGRTMALCYPSGPVHAPNTTIDREKLLIFSKLLSR